MPETTLPEGIPSGFRRRTVPHLLSGGGLAIMRREAPGFMPELPEVETIVRQLNRALRGRRLRRVQILDPKLALPGGGRDLAGRVVRRVFRSGKQAVVELGGKGRGRAPLWLVIHLRMTGRLIWVPAGRAAPVGHLRARFRLAGGELRYHDLRRFGRFRLARDPGEFAAALDPLTPACAPAALVALLAKSKQEIKPWLLRQDRLTGVGNIYAAEALFAAGIGPERRAGSLRAAEAARLCRALKKILARAVRWGGTTFSDYRDSRGRAGAFSRMLKVYQKAGRPCPRCRGRIARLVQQGRSTFYCPRCQH